MTLAVPRIAPRPEPDQHHLRRGMTCRDWAAVAERPSRVSSASTWALGDWLLFGERAFGRRYRTAILEAGGSRPAMDSFKAFRGRAPELDAQLRHQGRAPQNTAA